MFMISDGNMDPRELDLLEDVNVYDLINLPQTICPGAGRLL
jgi:hypothetical protein